jgi:hypothetical protein
VQEKAGYKAAIFRLKALKPEVEHLQLLLERGQRKMQDEFTAWHGIMLRRYQSSSSRFVLLWSFGSLQLMCKEA